MPARRVLILSSSTGGGHDMRADALESWLIKLQGSEVIVRRWQALEESSTLDRFGVGLYNWIQRHWPLAHHIYFNVLEILGLHRQPWGIRGKAHLEQMAREFRPEVVVSTHAHLNHGYFEVLRRALQPNPLRCLTYCGELHGGYGFSRHWVNSAADAFLAATPACAEAALGRGMSPDRTQIGGFLLKPDFYGSAPRQPEIVLPDNSPLRRPIILLGTGANGANNHLRILNDLDTVDQPLTFIALCGRDKDAQEELRETDFSPHSVIPVGQQKNIPALLDFVDLAFIRPGSGMTSECLHCNCPMLFNGIGGLMPQEQVTLRGVRALGLETKVVHRTRQFASTLKLLLDEASPHSLHRQKAQLGKIQNEGGPPEIVQEVIR